jgi:hypothetical protein
MISLNPTEKKIMISLPITTATHGQTEVSLHIILSISEIPDYLKHSSDITLFYALIFQYISFEKSNMLKI